MINFCVLSFLSLTHSHSSVQIVFCINILTNTTKTLCISRMSMTFILICQNLNIILLLYWFGFCQMFIIPQQQQQQRQRLYCTKKTLNSASNLQIEIVQNWIRERESECRQKKREREQKRKLPEKQNIFENFFDT